MQKSSRLLLPVAPVVLPASRQHHFRSVGAWDLDVSKLSPKSHGSADSAKLVSLRIGRSAPSGRTDLISGAQLVRDCSTAAPHTARLEKMSPSGVIFPSPAFLMNTK